ncbi:hypothetical protein VTO73DRAFT_11907 [Trametes versicolor]
MVTGIVLLFSMGPFFVNVCTFYQDTVLNSPPPEGCTGFRISGTVIVSRSTLIISDVLAIIVTWWSTRAARRISTHLLQRDSLQQIVWENGNIYFFALVSLSAVDMVLIASQVVSDVTDYIIPFVYPISTILNCRFLLCLYETDVHSERDMTPASESSFSTLDFGGADRTAGSPELPRFLDSLAGTIRSTYDDDPELVNSEPSPQPILEMQDSDGSVEEVGEVEEQV